MFNDRKEYILAHMTSDSIIRTYLDEHGVNSVDDLTEEQKVELFESDEFNAVCEMWSKTTMLVAQKYL